MNIRKLLSLCCCFALLLGLCGCKDKTDRTTDASQEAPTVNDCTVNLLYCSNDTMNPYTLITKVNAELSQLLYDPLYHFGNDFLPIPCLAESAVQDGYDWIITLKSAAFTDGTPLTGDDVAFSLSLAKDCPRYRSQLGQITGIEANGNRVVFHVSVVNPYFTNVLTFPILKKDSHERKDSDGQILPPIGTGRFIFDPEKERLVRHEAYFDPIGTVSTVQLINAPDNESVTHYVEVGATDFYYTETVDESVARMTAKKATVNRNDLIYLGINDADETLSDIGLRYAISAAISRNKLVSETLFGNAVAATGPLHPLLSEVSAYQTTETDANFEIAIENLEKIGYNVNNVGGFATTAGGKKLSLSLLVNADQPQKTAIASQLVSQLKEVGIQLTVNALSYDAYMDALNSGSFQLYLGETVLDADFDLSPLVIAGGSCAFGRVNNDRESAAVINRYHANEASLSDVITTLQAEMPFIPLCYRSGVLFYSEDFPMELNYCEDDLFMSFSKLIRNP